MREERRWVKGLGWGSSESQPGRGGWLWLGLVSCFEYMSSGSGLEEGIEAGLEPGLGGLKAMQEPLWG